MALIFTLEAGFIWDESNPDVFKLSDLNKAFSEGRVSSLSGTVDTANIGDLQVTTAKINDLAVTTGKLAATAVTQAKIAANALDGTVAGSIADDNVIGGFPVLHRIEILNIAGHTDVTLTHKTRIIDIWGFKITTGGAGDTVTVKNLSSGNDISDPIDLNIADHTRFVVDTIDDSEYEIAAGGTLRITSVKSTDCNCNVYVLGMRVA